MKLLAEEKAALNNRLLEMESSYRLQVEQLQTTTEKANLKNEEQSEEVNRIFVAASVP